MTLERNSGNLGIPPAGCWRPDCCSAQWRVWLRGGAGGVAGGGGGGAVWQGSGSQYIHREYCLFYNHIQGSLPAGGDMEHAALFHNVFHHLDLVDWMSTWFVPLVQIQVMEVRSKQSHLFSAWSCSEVKPSHGSWSVIPLERCSCIESMLKNLSVQLKDCLHTCDEQRWVGGWSCWWKERRR